MSQNYAYNPNAQGANGLAGGFQAPPALAYPAPMAPSFGLPGATPTQQAAAQQALQDPHAGDAFATPFGTPAELASGAAAGIVLGNTFEQMMKKDRAISVAHWIDNIPGIKQVSSALGKIELPEFLSKQPWAKELGFFLNEEAVKSAADPVAKAVQLMEQNTIGSITNPHFKQIDKLKNAEQKAAYQKVRDLLAGKNTFDDITKAAAEKMTALETKIAALPKANRKALQTELDLLRKIHDCVGSAQMHAPVFKEQAHIAYQLQKKGVGPIGKFYASSVNYLNRIFGGQTMMTGFGSQGAKEVVKEGVETATASAVEQAGVKGLWNRTKQQAGKVSLFGPALAGAMTIGTSLHRAHQAKDGEKTQTFFHDFIGLGIMNFVGWELGRKFLTKPVRWALGTAQGKHPFNFLKRLPMVGGWFGAITLAGFATEMLALWLVAPKFQAAGEWVSHKIFGKPSEESLDPSKKTNPQQQPASTQAMAGFSPALASAARPAYYPAGNFPQAQPQSYPPQMMGQTPPAFQTQQAFYNPAAGAATTPPMAPASPSALQRKPFQQQRFQQSPAAQPAVAQAPSAITPDQIRQSQAWQQSEALLKDIQKTYGQQSSR